MKKVYTKPAIMFEDFTLSTSIAGDCEVKLNTPNNTSCGYRPEGYDADIFVEGITGCAEKHADGTYGDGICYHVPDAGYNLFNS